MHVSSSVFLTLCPQCLCGSLITPHPKPRPAPNRPLRRRAARPAKMPPLAPHQRPTHTSAAPGPSPRPRTSPACSQPPLAKMRPSGEKASELTRPLWPTSVVCSCLSAVVHRRIDQSSVAGQSSAIGGECDRPDSCLERRIYLPVRAGDLPERDLLAAAGPGQCFAVRCSGQGPGPVRFAEFVNRRCLSLPQPHAARFGGVDAVAGRGDEHPPVVEKCHRD